MKPIKVRRFILIFEKFSEKFVEEVDFPADIELLTLQKIFGIPPVNPMFDVYEINAENVEEFSKIFYYEFDFSNFEYAIASEALS